MVSPETHARIVENCLGHDLGDAALAHELHANLRAQLIRDPERRYDMDLSVALAPERRTGVGHRAKRLTAVMDRELAMADAAIARTWRQLQQASPARMQGRTDRTIDLRVAPNTESQE